MNCFFSTFFLVPSVKIKIVISNCQSSTLDITSSMRLNVLFCLFIFASYVNAGISSSLDFSFDFSETFTVGNNADLSNALHNSSSAIIQILQGSYVLTDTFDILNRKSLFINGSVPVGPDYSVSITCGSQTQLFNIVLSNVAISGIQFKYVKSQKINLTLKQL